MERVSKREDVIAMSTLRSSNLQAGGSASGAWQAVHRPLFIFVKRFSHGGRGKQIRERAQRSVRDENVGEGRGG